MERVALAGQPHCSVPPVGAVPLLAAARCDDLEDEMSLKLTHCPVAVSPEPPHHARPSQRRAGRRGWRTLSVAVVVALAGCGVGANSTTQTPAPATAPASTPSMPAEGTIRPGTYLIPASAWSVADFEVTFPPGWEVQYGHVYSKHEDQPGEIGFYAVVVDQIYTDACAGEGVAQQVGPHLDDLVTALLEQPGPTASGPADATIGGRRATRIDFVVPDDLDLQSCRLADDGVLGLQVWYSPPADKYFVLLEDGAASAHIVDLDGHLQVFLTQHRAGTTAQDLSELQHVLESIHIEK